MSVTAFRPLITVTVAEHGSGKAIRALGFEPTAQTARRLADHRLVFRPWRNGFRLYAQYNPEAGGVRMAPITERTSFVFGIRLIESDFLARYHPDLDPASGPNLYLSNLKADGSARPSGQLSLGATVEKADAARIVARRLNVRADLTKTPKPASLKVTDHFDPARVVADETVEAPAHSDSAAVAIDLSHDLGIVYTLAPQPAGVPKTTLFADDELAGRGALGVLEWVAAPSLGADPQGGRDYSAAFRRRT